MNTRHLLRLLTVGSCTSEQSIAEVIFTYTPENSDTKVLNFHVDSEEHLNLFKKQLNLVKTQAPYRGWNPKVIVERASSDTTVN